MISKRRFKKLPPTWAPPIDLEQHECVSQCCIFDRQHCVEMIIVYHLRSLRIVALSWDRVLWVSAALWVQTQKSSNSVCTFSFY
ncbi:MAG: hypothetical protein EBT20_11585 [Alphaproteobacteria bacterium]|nr:hypothetical protein [Alphaproteobacteria bacterium]